MAIKPVRYATCFYDSCKNLSTAEGMFCREHWPMIPGAIKQQIATGLGMAAKAVKAEEDLKRGQS